MHSNHTLITGAAGFIGYHLSNRLLQEGHTVTGLDNLNDYYDVSLKEARLARLANEPRFSFHKMDLADRDAVDRLFAQHRFDWVVNLAAQPGVRYSLKNPCLYASSNVTGFLHLLEACRHHPPRHLVYASSSSIYGANRQIPFSVSQNVDHPVSLYAATKKAGELMAHTYSHLYGLPTTGLRFFTVYGPWGRPDMAPFLFTQAILAGKPIDVFNHGHMERDFTYIDDIVEGVVRVLGRIPQGDPHWDALHPNPGTSTAPYHVYNIGNQQPVPLLRFIEVIENCLGKKAVKNLLPLQPGDVISTCADIADLERDTGFKPATSIEAGLARFVAWYREYYGVMRGG